LKIEDLLCEIIFFPFENFIKIILIIKECPEEIWIKLAIVLKIQSLAETLKRKENNFRKH
jgi:hypothetical protein